MSAPHQYSHGEATAHAWQFVRIDPEKEKMAEELAKARLGLHRIEPIFVEPQESEMTEAEMLADSRQITKMMIGTALIGAVVGSLLTAAFPIHRNVTEHKVIVTTKRTIEEVVRKDVDERSGCLKGEAGTVVGVDADVYSHPDDPEGLKGTRWVSDVTLRLADDALITCKFEYVDGRKLWPVGMKVKLDGGVRY